MAALRGQRNSGRSFKEIQSPRPKGDAHGEETLDQMKPAYGEEKGTTLAAV